MGDQDPTETTAAKGHASEVDGDANDAKPLRVFTMTSLAVLATWAVLVVLFSGGMWFLVADHFGEAVIISLMSGLIAMMSFVPGIVGEWVPIDAPAKTVESGRDKKGKHDYISPLFGGIFLRLVATVALFVMCRYQMAASEQWIAMMIVGWYVVLTFVEVALLARHLPRSDRFHREPLRTVIPLVTSSVPETLTASN